MYVVVISLNGIQSYHEHSDYESALSQWAIAARDARRAMVHMGTLVQLFDSKIYITRLEDGKRKIIMAFDSKGQLEFIYN